MKRILVIEANPKESSFCNALARAYVRGAKEAGASVSFVRLRDLEFDPILWEAYDEVQDLEPDLLQLQENLKEAEHLVFVYPVWWSAMPALLKGVIDRIFLPGFAFRFHPTGYKWDKLLRGKSAHLIISLGTPFLPYVTLFGKAAHRMMVDGVLKFCGISPVKTTSIYQVHDLTAEERREWLEDIYDFGKELL